MIFSDLVKNRFLLRDYSDTPVSKEVINELLEIGRMAPSAANKQPWLFYVIEDPHVRNEINACYSKEWINQAPVLLVICGNHLESWKQNDNKDHCDIDVAIAIDHITLAATERGLGTCCICRFDTNKCAQILKTTPHIKPIALLPIGYKNSEPNTSRFDTARKKLDDIVVWK